VAEFRGAKFRGAEFRGAEFWGSEVSTLGDRLLFLSAHELIVAVQMIGWVYASIPLKIFTAESLVFDTS
jgi:hypothetical protein